MKTVFIIALSILSFVSCDNIVKQLAFKTGKKVAKETTENIAESATATTSRKMAKEIISEASEKLATQTISKSLKEAASSNETLGFFYDIF